MILTYDEARVLYNLLKHDWISHENFDDYCIAVDIIKKLGEYINHDESTNNDRRLDIQNKYGRS